MSLVIIVLPREASALGSFTEGSSSLSPCVVVPDAARMLNDDRVVSVCCLPDPSEQIKNFAKNKKQIKKDVATWVPHPTVPRRGRIEKKTELAGARHMKNQSV
jgi:hypothetical protein